LQPLSWISSVLQGNTNNSQDEIRKERGKSEEGAKETKNQKKFKDT